MLAHRRLGARAALVVGTLSIVALWGLQGTDRTAEGEQTKHERTGAAELLRERYRQRAGEDGTIPMDALVRAKEQIDAMRMRQADAGIWSWTWLGPGNIGGRIRSILPHPTIAGRTFIGSVSGGIWRTDNFGASWSPVNDFMQSLSVTSLAVDPIDTDVMYAATGEALVGGPPGAGIFKSVNGGASWFQLPSTNNGNFTSVNRIAHHPTASGTLYAASGSATQIFRTTDGGASWNSVLTTTSLPADVKIHATSPNRVLVGCTPFTGTQGEVFLSTDGGATWSDQTTGGSNMLPDTTGRCEVAFGPGNTMYVSMDRNMDGDAWIEGELWRSITASPSWSLRPHSEDLLGGQGSWDNTIWVDPTDGNRVVVGGVAMWRSTNGGLNWDDIADGGGPPSPHVDHHVIIAAPGYGTSNWRVYIGNDGGIYTTSDIRSVTPMFGWTSLVDGLGITQFYAGAAASDGSVILGGTQDNGNPVYQAGGSTGSWVDRTSGDGGYCAVDPTNPDILYASVMPLHIKKSTDGGMTFFDSESGLGDATVPGTVLCPFMMDPNNPNTLLAGRTRLWRTTDAAASWHMLRDAVPGSPGATAIDVRPGNSSEIWFGYGDGQLWRTTNAGASWVRRDGNPPGLPDRTVTDIAVSPYFSGEVVVVFSGYNSDNVWVTFDGGATWERRTGTAPDTLPALQVNTVTYHPSDENFIYIGTDLGVFASDDFGITWNATPAYPDNDGPANVEVDDLFWHSGEYLVAATHGRGMYVSRPLSVVFVDRSYVGPEDGTFARPYNTLAEGIGAAGHGTNLSVRANTYPEGPISFYKRGRVVGTNGVVRIH